MSHLARGPVAFDRRLKLTIALLAATAMLTLCGLRALNLWSRRTTELQAGEQRAANLALILGSHLRAVFAATDAALRQLTIHSREVGGPDAPPEKWNSVLALSRTAANSIGSVSVVDREGIIRHSSYPALVGSARHENSIFKRLAATPRETLLADTPFPRPSEPGIMLIPVGRRLAREDGTFDGIIAATLHPGELREFFAKVDVGRHGAIWVYHPEGTVLFSVPTVKERIGDRANGAALFEHAKKLAQPATALLPAQDKSAAAVAAFRPLNEPRMYLAITLDQAELLEDWQREVTVSAVVLGLMAVAFAGVVWLAFRQLDARAAAEEALQHAQRLDALGKLTGGVAHDFNNLLTVIMMNVSVMKLSGTGAPGSPDATQVEQIEAAAQRAASLTQQLLTFARRQPLQPKRVDLNELVGRMESMLARLLGEDVSIRIRLAAQACPAEVDPVQFETTLMNLCLNARDAMAQGGTLTIDTARVELDAAAARRQPEITAGHYVELTVTDTGAGIAPEHLPRIFEPFFTTKSVGKGTGLGLSMVYGFIRQSGGHVTAESEVGRGTVLRLLFPLAASAAAETPVALPCIAPEASGELILLVEDEPLVRDVAEIMLRRLGYRVVSAANGREALERAQTLPRIDLLLTDVMLPGGTNGRQLAEELTRVRGTLRVLYASGYSADILQDRGQFSPTLRLLAKPYEMHRMAAAIRAVLAEEPMTPPAAAVQVG
jgi:signal transduction histidine kinase/ActR/RegA family two-component response regulator